MAKSNLNGNATRRGTDRERPAEKSKKPERRVILFPTEPSTIGEDKIRRAVERVVAARKK
jgi:hypothetical protein